jgi:hypothetical protein
MYMSGEIYDRLSILFSWGWPTATGEVTGVGVERAGHELRLAVTYKFWVGSDGPYTGEGFWRPRFSSYRRILAARHKVRPHQTILVRYRAEDPSVNTPDRELWRRL